MPGFTEIVFEIALSGNLPLTGVRRAKFPLTSNMIANIGRAQSGIKLSVSERNEHHAARSLSRRLRITKNFTGTRI